MNELLARAESGGWPIAVLLGDPVYYSRFGFQPSACYGITYTMAGPDNPHFMVRVFTTLSVDGGADFTYCWERSDP